MVTTLREQMTALREAMGMLVELQRNMHFKLDAAMKGQPLRP